MTSAAATTPKRLFIVDAMAMIFRSYHAFGPRQLTNSSGQPTSAIFGSALFLLKLLEDERPDYLVVTTDSREPTFRHQMYAEYKANRTAMPEDLASQIPYIYRLFQLLGLTTLARPGLEADDIIASLVHQYNSPELTCYIVSGDKDLMQLVGSNVRVYAPKKGGTATVYGTPEVREKFGIEPNQIMDYLAIVGDASDNIPGVRGIGEKGAAKLIQQFGSLDGIYEHLSEIANERMRKALVTSKETAYTARTLLALKSDELFPVALHDFVCTAQPVSHSAELLALLHELEFRGLADRVKAWGPVEPATVPNANLDTNPKPLVPLQPATADDRPYHLIQDRHAMEQLFARLATAERFAVDTETTGLDKMADRPIGISFSLVTGEAYYLPLHSRHLTDLAPSEAISALRKLLMNAPGIKIGHNLKFDFQMLANIDVKVRGDFRDTMIAAYLLNPILRDYSLDSCCLAAFQFVKIPTSAIFVAAGSQSMLDAPVDVLARYACEDADYTLRLYEHYQAQLCEQNLLRVYETIESPLVEVLATMEQTGVFVDANALLELSTSLQIAVTELSAKILEAAGEEFNINSPKQLGVILFEKLKVHEQLGIKKIKKTQSGYSTDVTVLEKLSAHPLPATVLEYRSVHKLKNTYVDALPQLIHPRDSRLHTQFHQTGTATGRLSSSDPNLQNIPIRTALGRQIRRAFSAQDKNSVIISADYSQVELRLLAHMTEDAALCQAFRENIDIHTDTAARIFGVAHADVTGDLRSKAKAINFGIIYGMGPMRLARDTGMTMDEAKTFIQRYFATYPSIQHYIDSAIAAANTRGFSETMIGRRRPIPELKAKEPQTIAFGENIAVNSPVQGSAADLIKLAMIRIHRRPELLAHGARMVLQVHDELLFECPKSSADDVAAIVQYEMEHAMDLKVPLRVEVGTGPDWLAAHE